MTLLWRSITASRFASQWTWQIALPDVPSSISWLIWVYQVCLAPSPPSDPTHHQVELTTLLLSSLECPRHNTAAGLMTQPQSRSLTFGLRWTGIKYTYGLYGVCYGQAKALLSFILPDRCPDEHRIPPKELCSPKNPPLPEPHSRTPRTVKKQSRPSSQQLSVAQKQPSHSLGELSIPTPQGPHTGWGTSSVLAQIHEVFK